MGCDLSLLLLLNGGQIRLDVLGVATNQVNSPSNHHVEVDDPGAAAFSFALRRPSQFPDPTRSRYLRRGVRMVNPIDGQCFDAV